jgi:hypothetical protein
VCEVLPSDIDDDRAVLVAARSPPPSPSKKKKNVHAFVSDEMLEAVWL